MNIPKSAPSHHGTAFFVNATLQPVFFSMILSMILDSSVTSFPQNDSVVILSVAKDLLIYIFNTTIVLDDGILDEVLELAVHLVCL